MTRKDITELIVTPICMFIMIAIAALFIYFKTRHQAADISSEHQQFDSFVQDVKSGKQQLSTDRAIAIIRQGRLAVDSYRMAVAYEAFVVQLLAWICLIGIVLQ